MSNERMEADVVVVGSGVAGLAAAIAATERGARVIVLEKQPSLGGTSNFFGGIFGVETDMQKVEYIAYSRDQAFKNFMEYNHWRSNAPLARALINRSADTIRWLQEAGVEFPKVTINMPDAPRTYHVVKGGGEAVVKALTVKAKNMGVTIKVGAPAKKIVKRDGRPAGVVAEIDGKEAEIACKAVVIASGGYANNKEWVKKYTGFDLGVNVFPIGNVDKMGDGIRMAWEMGGAAEGMGVLHILRVAAFSPEFPLMNVVEAAAIQPVVWIDPQGRRFCDEGICDYDTSTGNVNARFAKGYTFSLFDDAILRHFTEQGVFRGVGQAIMAGEKLKDLEQQLQYMLSLNTKELFGAGSLEELAGKIEVDPSVLKATVEEYNGFCAKGRDDAFAKDQRYLLPLTGPRFYAARGRTAYLGTLGGIRVNNRTEIVDKYDNPVSGLYAAGDDLGGLHPESYSMKDTSGITAAFAVNSGRVAGENAAKYVKGQ